MLENGCSSLYCLFHHLSSSFPPRPASVTTFSLLFHSQINLSHSVQNWSYHLLSSAKLSGNLVWTNIALSPPLSLSLFFFASVPLYILLPRIISIGTSPFSLLLALDDLHKACRATPQLDAAVMIWYVITAELLKRWTWNLHNWNQVNCCTSLCILTATIWDFILVFKFWTFVLICITGVTSHHLFQTLKHPLSTPKNVADACAEKQDMH